jgi:hypothetical protein
MGSARTQRKEGYQVTSLTQTASRTDRHDDTSKTTKKQLLPEAMRNHCFYEVERDSVFLLDRRKTAVNL